MGSPNTTEKLNMLMKSTKVCSVASRSVLSFRGVKLLGESFMYLVIIYFMSAVIIMTDIVHASCLTLSSTLSPETLSLVATRGNLGTMNSTVLTQFLLRVRVTGLKCESLSNVNRQ